MTKRKKIKLALLIPGAAVTIFGFILFFIFFFPMSELIFSNMKISALVMFAGLAPVCISFLMHAKDIRENKKAKSIVLTVFAWYWIGTGSLNLLAIIIPSLIFGW